MPRLDGVFPNLDMDLLSHSSDRPREGERVAVVATNNLPKPRVRAKGETFSMDTALSPWSPFKADIWHYRAKPMREKRWPCSPHHRTEISAIEYLWRQLTDVSYSAGIDETD